MRPVGSTLAAFILLASLLSCAEPQIHLHDRHGLSYPLVRDFAKSHPGSTLVLLDYHHDVGAGETGPTSSNWVGTLLREGLVSRVVWVSGRDLLLPNRNSRLKWLHRSLEGFPPSDSARIAQHVMLSDWEDLRVMQLRGPLIVSLDLDILVHDPGDPPERFLDELAAWVQKQRAPLLTVALSAAYQRDASPAWAWLQRFVEAFPQGGAAWYLEGGPPVPSPEGNEEMGAWRLWEGLPGQFQRYDGGFWPGPGIWIGAPRGLRRALLKRGVRPGDQEAREIVSGWRDQDRAALEETFPPDVLDGLASAAAASLEATWMGETLREPAPGISGKGVAVRFLSGGLDRGCLSLYAGVDDLSAAVSYCAQAAAADSRYPPVRSAERQSLELELSVFGPWRAMDGPLDFRPGLDSVLLMDTGRTTLLQASLAVERGYDRAAFLRVLARKAGLGAEGWRDPGVRFKRALTIWSTRPLTVIEGASFNAKVPRNR
jgi:AMMECR1